MRFRAERQSRSRLASSMAAAAEKCATDWGKQQVDQATQEATAKVVENLQKIKADADQALHEVKGTVKSIIQIAQGLKDEDWAKIAYFGSKELAKIVLTLIVEVICPPCALIAGPVIAELVDLYGDYGRGAVRSDRDRRLQPDSRGLFSNSISRK